MNVYPGNTADSKTVPDQVVKIREKFSLTRVILVGDRGMLTQTQIDTLRQYPGLGWISALRAAMNAGRASPSEPVDLSVKSERRQ